MNKKQLSVIVPMLIAAIILGLFILKKDRTPQGGDHGEAPPPAQASKGASADVATPEKKGPDGDHDTVQLSTAQIGAASITTEKAAPTHLATYLTFPGEVRFNEDRTAHVVPRVAGIVEAVPASLGEQVRQNQVLAVIASTAVSEQRSELAGAQLRLELARTTLTREKKLWEEKISAEQDYLQARNALQEAEITVTNARQKLAAIGVAPTVAAGNRFELRAPFSGMVVEKHATLGESIKEDAAVFTIADLSTVWANFNVPARDIGVVRVGKRAVVRATALGTEVSGTVSYIGSLIGEQTRTAIARVTLKNPEGAWRPGLFVEVAVVSGDKDVAVSVSNEALQTLEGNTVVFVRTPEGFRAQPIKAGLTDGKRTEITSGIAVGDEIATAGSYMVKAELTKSAAGDSH